MFKSAIAAVAVLGLSAVSAMAQDAGAPPVAAADTGPAPGPAQATEAGWREVSPDNLLIIDTNKGRILVEMAPEVAPGHVERIRMLARQGFYNGIRWHRVIDWFMAQTGDPLGNGDGQSYYPDLTAEFTFRRGPEAPFTAVASPMGSVVGFMGSMPVETQPDSFMALTEDGKVHGWGLYCPGVAGMARGEENDSANSQFFLMRQAYPSLDKRYTVWGRVVSGLDVVRALQFGTDPYGAVPERDVMTLVRVASDMAEGDRPRVRMLATDSQAFASLVERVRGERGADFSICDIDLPSEVY